MGLFTKVAVTPEATPVGSLNTLTQPDYVLAEEHTLPKQQFNSELGYRQAYRTQLAKVSSYELDWSALTLTELSAIRTFYLDHDGSVVPFNWTPQGETAARLFYFSSELNSEQAEPNVYSASVSIVELSPAAFP